MARSPDFIIVDIALPEATAFDRSLFDGLARVETFRGDVGPLWLHGIEPALRARPVSIAGYTSAATLFCLQYLARDRGLELRNHATLRNRLRPLGGARADLVDLRGSGLGGSCAAVSWLLAPAGV